MPPTTTRPRRLRFLSSSLVALMLAAAALYVVVFAGGEPERAVAVPPPELTKEQRQKIAIDAFFNGPILSLAIELTPAEVERLKKDERNYVEAKIGETGKPAFKVALKLKGAAGSFQGFDGKPGMTLNFDKFKGSERFHGVKKLHLNNCAQDGTYLHEFIAGEMARKAGVPASRCTHAFVTLNGRDLGLYVVKEAFTRDFLGSFFSDTTGDLYDGGFCKEIEENMEKDLGDSKDRRDVKELIAACQEGDAAKRWERLGKVLDVERFASFTAMESILSHWDGYNFNRNNYRVYRDAETGKFSFFLHGMDQVFNDPNGAAVREPGSLVGGAMWRSPEGRALYQERVKQTYETVLKPIDWPARVVEQGTKVRDAIAATNPQRAKEYQAQIEAARGQIAGRIAAIGKQLGDLPKPVAFGTGGVLSVAKDWRIEGAAAQIDEQTIDGKATLHVRTEGETVASWRKNLALPAGKYRFEASVRTAGVAATQSGSGEGAGVRISGGNRTGQNSLKGDSGWQAVKFEFDTAGGEIVLVAELRATKGEVWFERESLRIVQVK